MKYRTIGTDPAHRREVSVLALGAMLFGSLTDEKTSFDLLDRSCAVPALPAPRRRRQRRACTILRAALQPCAS